MILRLTVELPLVGDLLEFHGVSVAHQQVPDVHARAAVEDEEERRSTATPAHALDRRAARGVRPRDQRSFARRVMQAQCAVFTSGLQVHATTINHYTSCLNNTV